MGRASISIAVTGSYNGAAIQRAEKQLDRLAAKTAAAEGSMSRSWSVAGSKAAEAGGRIYNAGQKVADAGDAMTMGVTVPLAAVAASSVSTATQFESSMSRVSGALADPSADMEGLRQLALDMGAQTVFSASQAGSAMEELAKGGLTEADIKAGALKTTMDLAAAGGLDLAEAANVTVQAMGAFNLEAGQTGEAANALAGAAAASSADVSDLTQGLSQVSAQANSAGWSIQDTTAVLAAFADAGIKGSDAGTSLKTMLQRLAAPTDQAAGMMESLGINVRDSSGQMLDASGIASELSTKLSTLDSATRDAALQTIFGADASRAALVMMNQGSEGISRYTAATNDQTAAQRLADSQMGETQRAIEEMNGAVETASIQLGGALAPAVTDAANAVGGAAGAFSELDEGTQQSIVGMGMFVAAAGPVMSVTGRIVKGVGNMVTAYGKAKQDVAAYADAMTTTNAASLEAYKSNEKLAKALAKNPAVKAAGGVDQYVAAVKNANAETSRYNAKVREYEREVKKGAKANQELIGNLSKEVAERRKQMDAARGTVQGYKQTAAAATTSSAAVTASSVAMKAGAVAAGVLKGALLAIAPVAVISGIMAIAQNLEDVEEKERLTTQATEGLVQAASRGASAANASAEALSAYGESAGAAKVDIDSVIESQAQLVATLNDTNNSASAQMAQLDSAYQTIQKYANQSNLSADAQGKLKSAVETVNQLCGTQISVTDQVNGTLSDENGIIGNVTQSIGDYIAKKMEQIRVDAQQQNLTALYQQQADDIAAVAQAQQEYNAIIAETGGKQQFVNDYMNQGAGFSREMALAAWEGVQAEAAHASGLDTAKAALESCNASIETVTTSLGAQAQAASGSATGLQNIVLASPAVATAMQSIGGDINAFAVSMGEAGVSVETFRSLNETQLAQLASDYDGTTQSIVASLSNMGIQMHDSGLRAANALASGMDSGKLNVEAATSVLKSAASGDWTSVVSQMSSAGISLPQGVADGITANSFAPSAATDSMLSVIALKLTGGDVKAAANLLGSDIDAGLANGIMNGTLSAEQAALLGQEVIDNAKTTLQSHSPSMAFHQIGLDVDAGLANGITGGTEGPLSAMDGMLASLFGVVQGADTPGKMRTEGASSSTSLAGGITSGIGSVASSALNVARTAATMKDAGDMRTPGSDLSSALRAGIASNTHSVYTAASAISSNAARMVWNGNTFQSGQHLVSNFAIGISAGINWVANAAWSVAQAAKNALGFSVPEEGPWSGSEKGGETSGLHLAQNFASGMLKGQSAVSDAARGLAGAAYFEANASWTSGGIRATGSASYDDGQVRVLLSEMVNLLREIASKDSNAYIGVNDVSTALAQASRVTAKARGFIV